jgi:hypothetical protein
VVRIIATQFTRRAGSATPEKGVCLRRASRNEQPEMSN